MKLTINLPVDVMLALRRLSYQMRLTPEDTAEAVIKDHLTSIGVLEPSLYIDEETETAGEA